MYDWMTVDEIIWFCKGFYPTWDDALAAELKAKLDLPGGKKVGQLSRGMQAKAALLVAIAYRPEVLILDEPTAGLDVVVRRDFLEGVIEMIQQSGRTVFFFSHIVHEVESVADCVGGHQGRFQAARRRYGRRASAGAAHRRVGGVFRGASVHRCDSGRVVWVLGRRGMAGDGIHLGGRPRPRDGVCALLFHFQGGVEVGGGIRGGGAGSPALDNVCSGD